MKNLVIEEPENPVDEKTIKSFEEIIGAKFPEDYKNFLLKYNGGHPKANHFPLIEPIDNDAARGNEGGIDWFLALYDGDVINMKDNFEMLKGRIPGEMIPIADAYGGDVVCLCVKGPNYGKVYYWDHENENPEDDNPWYENVYLIANSFTDFINSLHEYDEPQA